MTKTQQFDCVFTPTPVPLLADRVFCNVVHSAAIDPEGRPMVWGGSYISPTLVRRCGPPTSLPIGVGEVQE